LTIAKFCYVARILGINAMAIFREIAGINDDNFYGRYTASGNPLSAFRLASSIAGMIETGTNLRAVLETAITVVIRVTQVGGLPNLNPAVTAVLVALQALLAGHVWIADHRGLPVFGAAHHLGKANQNS
jgi:hypothetical protein